MTELLQPTNWFGKKLADTTQHQLLFCLVLK